MKMKTRLWLEVLEAREVPATFTWVGDRDGVLNSGYVAANWRDQNNQPGVPDAGDDIIIPATSGDLCWGNVTVGSVTIEAGWDRTWGADGLTITGDSNVRDATFYLTVRPLLIADSSTLTGDNVTFRNDQSGSSPGVVVETSSSITLAAGASFTFYVDLQNLGTITLGNHASFAFGASCEFWNRFVLNFAANARINSYTNLETFKNTGFVSQLGDGVVYFETFVDNRWLIVTAGSGSKITFDNTWGLHSVVNSGILRVQNGTAMEFKGGGLYSSGGEIQTVEHPTNNTQTIALMYGLMDVRNTIIWVGYNSTTGKNVLNVEDLTLTGSTLNIALNWTGNRLDSLWGTYITLTGSNTLNIRQYNRPAILPPNTSFLAVNATILTGDFTGWGIADLTHSKANNKIWLHVPPPMSPPPMSPPPP